MAAHLPAKRAGNGLLILLSLCLVLNAAMYLHTTSCAHRVQLHLVGQQRAQANSSVDAAPPRSASRNDLRLNVSAWLAFAAEDAAQHGLHISEACDNALGEGFLRRFSSTWGTLCGAASGDTQVTQSSVQCAAYPVEGLGLACASKQLLVNATAFMGPAVPKGQQAHDKYMPQGLPGSVGMDCHMLGRDDSVPGSRSVWESGAAANLQKEQLPWFKHAAQANKSMCDGASHMVHHPVMFVTRLDTTNPYHHTQSLVQAFLTLAVVQNNTPLSSLQVVLADHFDPGPFTKIWGRLSSPHPVVSLDSPAFAGGNTCILRGIHAHYVGPGRAFLGYEGIGSEKTCASSILMAFAHWQRYLFRDMLLAHEQQAYRQLEMGPLSLPHPLSGNSNHRLNVVWLSRSWFSKSMKAGGGLTGWQASRDLSHEQESDIVRALQQAVMDWNRKACAPPVFGWWQRPHEVPKPSGCKAANVSFDFHSVDLSVQDLYPEQVTLLTRTAVLVGVHGAALTNQVWMRPHRGAIVEFGAGANFHYVNMAHMLGHKHLQASSAASQLADAVTQAMDHVSSKY